MEHCPACDARLTWRHNGAWCDRCHRKVETCCEGAPQREPADAMAGAPSGPSGLGGGDSAAC